MKKYILFITLLLLTSCCSEYKYDIGECNWHINENDKRGVFFKVVKKTDVNGEKYYISEIVNYRYKYNAVLYQLQSASYIDDMHSSYTHEEKCKLSVRKDLIDKCIKDKTWEFASRSAKCPTKEEFEKMKVK